MNPIEKEQILRAALLVPCDSKASLHRWIKTYLGIDLPDHTIDPMSTSNPMDFVWEIYSKGLAQDPNFGRILAYAARETMKSLDVAILELLFVLHMERDCGHMAAIEFQARNVQGYVKKFHRRPFIRDFVTKDNDRTIEFTKFKHIRGEVSPISPIEYAKLTDTQKVDYKEYTNKIVIVIATLNATNSLHCPLFVRDETDLANPAAIRESKMVPSQGPNGEPSITIDVSTRKFAFGNVQQELDNAEESGLFVRTWNIIDVTQSCPSSRCLFDRPKIPIYTDKVNLRAIGQADYDLLSEQEKAAYETAEGYQGCLRNCRIFPACQGRLATEQKSRSPMLKLITEVQSRFRSLDVDTAKAQLLCWKPSLEGMIFPRLDRKRHCLTAAQMAEKITGDPFPETFSKAELISLMKSRDMRFVGGADHGHTHCFSVTIGAVDGSRLFVIDVLSEAELEVAQKVDRCKERFEALGINPEIWADTEDPASNKTLRRYFKIKDWQKTPGSVLEGIQIVRLKMNPTLGGEPEMFFLAGDPGVELLVKRMQVYHWKVDAAERLTSDPDKVDDDEIDSCRYLVMNVFGKRGRLVVSPEQTASSATQPISTAQNWMGQQIESLTGDGQSQQVSGTKKVGSSFFISS